MSSSATAGAAAPAPVAAAAASLGHPLTLSLLALTFTTGLIDAASYLGLGHVFTANMTGNVVLLGFGIAGAAGDEHGFAAGLRRGDRADCRYVVRSAGTA